MKSVLKVTAHKYVLSLRLNGYKVSKKIPERKLLKNDVILKVLTSSVKQLKSS